MGLPDTPTELVVAAVQTCSGEDVSRNLARCSELVEQASAAGAELVGLPENFAYLGSDRDHKVALAESLEQAPDGSSAGPILGAMQGLASRLKIWLLLGGFPEKSAGQAAQGSDPHIHNTSVLLDPTGQIAARYRKVHLFDVEVPGGQRFCESDVVRAGDEAVVTDLPWGRVGLTICYDLRFPELYRELARQGARLITAPAAFTQQTGKDHWHVLLRARAIENQAWVMAPAQWGKHGGNRVSYGHAMIVDPWGCIAAECGDHEGFALARINSAYQDDVRKRLPVLKHRKM